MQNKSYHVYFLQSLKDNSYYIGVTNNVQERFKDHNNGFSKSTASKRPWILKRVEKYPDIRSAYQRERFLKAKKSKKIIEKIINSGK
jgi:putative endonuclease